MDYPKSVPNIGLVDGHFVDENPVTGQIGSLIPAAWGDAITQEVLNVIKGAGMVPDEANVSQLLSAVLAIAASDVKKSVRVATTGPIALSGLQTIDDVALVAGDRVLVKNQANAAQNWIYTAAAGAWVRAKDADESIECAPGHLVPVQAGTRNAGTSWQLSSTTPPVLGATALVFEQAGGKTGVTPGPYFKVSVDAYGHVRSGANPTTLQGFGILDAITKIESTEAIQVAISALVAEAPSSLDTLKKLASAIGSDPNFSTTTTNALASMSIALQGKAPKATTLTGYGITDAVSVANKATQTDAEAGVNDTKWMTPLGVFRAFTSFVSQATETAFGWAKVAGQSAMNAGNDDTTFVTPKKLRNGFSVQFDGTGYIALPSWMGGWILQWVNAGSIPSLASGGFVTKTLTWPLTFPVGPMVPWGIATGATASEVGMVVTPNGMNSTGMNLSVFNAAQASKGVQSVIGFVIGR
ncbi:hypothetical protein MF6396_26215 [Pseudomonas sp. MF6396]|nr:hypothetical protein [Pseudomonas sp. MF6396]OOV91957.1 hypothetical protein MF6396_26215 [Pseudomonas sp. MF6396]